MFLVPHPKKPMVTFEHLQPLLSGPAWQVTLLVLDLAAMVMFGLIHLFLLGWNVREYIGFRRTPAFEALKNSNAEVSLMAIPLTLGMTVNVLFVHAVALVPNLWQSIESLFPVGIAAYTLIGVYPDFRRWWAYDSGESWAELGRRRSGPARSCYYALAGPVAGWAVGLVLVSRLRGVGDAGW
jgi:hypothetical protein